MKRSKSNIFQGSCRCVNMTKHVEENVAQRKFRKDKDNSLNHKETKKE